MSGTLEVTLIAARNLKSKDGLFGSNDPYAIIKLHHQKFKSEVKKKAGKECQWNQTFRFGITEKYQELHLEVYDEDQLSDDLIGKTAIPLQGIVQTGFTDAWYTIGKGSSSRGEVHAMIRFTPGAFPQDFDPNASSMDDNLKMAGGVAGGVIAAGALAYGAKMAYDHYNKKEEAPPGGMNQGQAMHQGGSNQPGYGSNQSTNFNAPPSGGSQYGGQKHGGQQGGYGGQQHGGQQGGYGGQQGSYGGQQHGGQQGSYGGQQHGGQQGGYGGQQGGYGGQQHGGQQGGYPSQGGSNYSMPQGPNSGSGYPPQGGYH